MLSWARDETKKRGITPRELLNALREKIIIQTLAAQNGQTIFLGKK